MNAPHVDIVLPVFNGARFLPEQLASLRAQTHQSWTLYARDDGSADGTPALLSEAERADPRVKVLRDGRGNLGPAQNVSALLSACTARYMFLCDQDDIWQPGKIEAGLRALSQLEQRFGADVPALVFSDLELIDGSARTLAPSFLAHRSLDPVRGTALGSLLVRNTVVGCTMAFNDSLRRRAIPIPPTAYMHDWWIALVAAAFGHIAFLPEPLVRYRQHGANVLGAGRGLTGDLLKLARSPSRVRSYFERTRTQARAFDSMHGHALAPKARAALRAYVDAEGILRPVRLALAGVRDTNPLRNVALALFG